MILTEEKKKKFAGKTIGTYPLTNSWGVTIRGVLNESEGDFVAWSWSDSPDEISVSKVSDGRFSAGRMKIPLNEALKN